MSKITLIFRLFKPIKRENVKIFKSVIQYLFLSFKVQANMFSTKIGRKYKVLLYNLAWY